MARLERGSERGAYRAVGEPILGELVAVGDCCLLAGMLRDGVSAGDVGLGDAIVAGEAVFIGQRPAKT